MWSNMVVVKVRVWDPRISLWHPFGLYLGRPYGMSGRWPQTEQYDVNWTLKLCHGTGKGRSSEVRLHFYINCSNNLQSLIKRRQGMIPKKQRYQCEYPLRGSGDSPWNKNRPVLSNFWYFFFVQEILPIAIFQITTPYS